MEWDSENASSTFLAQVSDLAAKADWENLRVAYLGKKNGLVTDLVEQLRNVPREEKPRLGKAVNQFKSLVEKTLQDHPLAKVESSAAQKVFDYTLPGYQPAMGSLHPLTLIQDRMVEFFVRQGYDVAEGPQIETAYYNFEALNTPESHPARDEQDTFYFPDGRLLRTQTSGVQIRYMETHQPPFRMIAPGKVYRRDDDITHSPMFHQLEGLVVGEGITFSDLKGTLQAFSRYLFGPETQIRLRPSYFPFTEPSAEVDVSCPFCSSGCRTCKQTRWLEILGSGMVDDNVLKGVGIDPERYTGFAFGMGIERIAMLALGIPDIRWFYQNDRRFLDPFSWR
ncbi:MAG: phenylalanine--tRNA ligase subunit alpha [Acidobacteria bacterium]|nr:phenylalanine--tRNA ligase subunit alpha [Acidobacteriota bacterium]MCB9398683.1 phenylalanine--tRNA ligase subunit alpha [Acidobacteriota bacterium]